MLSPKDPAFRSELTALLPRLTRFTRHLSSDPDLAKDLVQACCVKALAKEVQFTPGTRLDRWLFAIIASEWKNHLRARRVRLGAGHVPAESALTADFASEADTHILMNQLRLRIGCLHPLLREAVQLVYFEGHTYREAATQLGVPLGTLMSRLASARLALGRDVLEADG